MESPAQSVFGPPGRARAMIDDQLGHPRALPGREDRDEPVHLAIQPHAFENTAAVRLQCAAEVVQGDSGEPRNQPVGDPRRHLARHKGVVAILPPARNDVVAGLELCSAAGECPPGRSAGRRRWEPGSLRAPGRARPTRPRSGRSCAAGTQPARARDHDVESPRVLPSCRRSSRHRQRSARNPAEAAATRHQARREAARRCRPR